MTPENLKRLTELLNRYFDGETSPAEEAEIEALAGNAGSLPAELEADLKAFAICRGEAVPVPPEGMLSRLEDAIDRRAAEEIAADAKSRLRRNRLAWTSVAAAAVVAIALLVPALRQSPREPIQNDNLIAEVNPAPYEEDNEKTDSALPAEPRPQETPSVNAAPGKPKRVSPKPSLPAAGTTPTRIVDNPDEAAMYLANALRIVDKTKKTAEERVSECNMRLERAGQILNRLGDRLRTAEADPA